MTRVIHTGDTHIGYQQYHSPERRRDFLRAFERVVEDAVEGEVAAVVHAGDLFHDRRPELRDLLGTISALRTLDDAGIPFLAVVGNHESTRGGQWLDLFERLGLATRLGSDPERVGDVALYGLDHVPKSRREELDYEFAPHDAAYAALVTHGLFQPFPHGDWDAEEVLTESSVDFDAMLLGDNHTPDTAEVAGAWVTYCGSTERASASEEAARGYNLVTFDPDADGGGDGGGAPAGVDIRRRSLDDTTREFAFVSVELAPGEGVERVREQLRQYDLEEAVVIVEVTGEGEPVTPAEIETFAAERGALIARVRDRREAVEAEADLSVSFADPDDAVRERVEELGLSTAALNIDETVRASKTADSNVRAAVKERVEGLLDEPAAFEAADADETADGDDGAGAIDDAEGDEAGGEDRAPAESAEGDREPPDESEQEAEREAVADAPDGPGDPGAVGSEGVADAEGREEAADDGEDQSSMGDFL